VLILASYRVVVGQKQSNEVTSEDRKRGQQAALR
jgi:hypothetical protein